VPYRGAAPAMTDLLGRQLDALFGDGPTVMAHIGAGKIRAIRRDLATALGKSPGRADLRGAGLADTVADQWAGVLAPARTPAAVVAKLNAAIVAVIAGPRGARQAGAERRRAGGEFAGGVRALSARRVCALGPHLREKGIKAD